MVDLERSGLVTFTFRCNTSRQVYLVGDFNSWDAGATPMRFGANGMWSLTVKLPPGRHEFRYWEEGCAWHTDFAAFGVVRNAFGDFNSIVEVLPPLRLKAMPPEAYPFSGGQRRQ